MSARELDLGFAPALALRVTYLGELGYELHVPVEYALDLYERLWAAGEPHGIANAGYRAINSLRLEKHYLVVGLGHHARLQPVRGGPRLLRRARQGRVPRPRRARRRQGAGSARNACTWFTAPPELNLLRRRNRARRRSRARAA